MVQAATKIMLINLKNGLSKEPYITTEICEVKSEDSLVYLMTVGGKEQTVLKSDTNEVKFVEVYSMVDGKSYWLVDAYVYTEIDVTKPRQQFTDYWVEELKKRIMEELKAKNALIKNLYNTISQVTA